MRSRIKCLVPSICVLCVPCISCDPKWLLCILPAIDRRQVLAFKIDMLPKIPLITSEPWIRDQGTAYSTKIRAYSLTLKKKERR